MFAAGESPVVSSAMVRAVGAPSRQGLPDAATPILPVIDSSSVAAHSRPASSPPDHPDRRAGLAVGRRRLLAALLAAGALPTAARAHHGFAGKYDFSRPMYVAG